MFGDFLHVLEEDELVLLLQDGVLVEAEDGKAGLEQELDSLQQKAVHNTQNGLQRKREREITSDNIVKKVKDWGHG